MNGTLGASLRASLLSIADHIDNHHRPLFNSAFLMYVLISYVEHLNLSDVVAPVVEGVGDFLKMPLLVLFFILLLVGSRDSRKRLTVSIILVALGGITWVVGGSSRLFWADTRCACGGRGQN